MNFHPIFLVEMSTDDKTDEARLVRQLSNESLPAEFSLNKGQILQRVPCLFTTWVLNFEIKLLAVTSGLASVVRMTIGCDRSQAHRLKNTFHCPLCFHNVMFPAPYVAKIFSPLLQTNIKKPSSKYGDRIGAVFYNSHKSGFQFSSAINGNLDRFVTIISIYCSLFKFSEDCSGTLH